MLFVRFYAEARFSVKSADLSSVYRSVVRWATTAFFCLEVALFPVMTLAFPTRPEVLDLLPIADRDEFLRIYLGFTVLLLFLVGVIAFVAVMGAALLRVGWRRPVHAAPAAPPPEPQQRTPPSLDHPGGRSLALLGVLLVAAFCGLSGLLIAASGLLIPLDVVPEASAPVVGLLGDSGPALVALISGGSLCLVALGAVAVAGVLALSRRRHSDTAAGKT